MKLLINKNIVKAKTYDIYLSDEDVEDEEYYFNKASKVLTSYSVDHQLALKGSYYNFVLYEQKVTLDEVSANEVLSVLSEFIDFELNYIPRGTGCEVCFELTEKKEQQ